MKIKLICLSIVVVLIAAMIGLYFAYRAIMIDMRDQDCKIKYPGKTIWQYIPECDDK